MTAPCAVRTDLTGAAYATYRIGGPLDGVVMPASLAEASETLTWLVAEGLPLTVIGWGSNLIIASRGIRGITLITRKMDWITPLDATSARFGAGVHLAKSAKWAESHSLTGGEYMIGIPGTVGGAVRMNAGALGQETAGLVRSVTLFNLATARTETWLPHQLGYRYRHSNLNSATQVVLEAELAFEPGDGPTITHRMEESVAFRKAHHPTEPNGGSVFKNPYPKDSPDGHKTAGWMLDQLGAKAWVEGGVRVSPMHANFIVNTGEGTSLQLLTLMRRMQQAAQQQFGATLLPENLLIGDVTDDERALWREITGGKDVGEH